MKFFLRMAQFFMIPTLITVGYDAVKSWFIDANFKLRSLEVWWRWFNESSMAPTRRIIRTMLSDEQTNAVFNAPACLDLFIISMFFYLIYRIIFLINGGKSTGGFTYKSRH